MRLLIVLIILAISGYGHAQEIGAISVKAFSVSTKDVDSKIVDEWITVKDGLLTYDKDKGELTGTINESPRALSWRLVHDGKKVIDKFECQGVTRSAYTIFIAKTEKEIDTEIEKLKLVGLPNLEDLP